MKKILALLIFVTSVASAQTKSEIIKQIKSLTSTKLDSSTARALVDTMKQSIKDSQANALIRVSQLYQQKGNYALIDSVSALKTLINAKANAASLANYITTTSAASTYQQAGNYLTPANLSSVNSRIDSAATALALKANFSAIPTNTNQLINGSGFITSSALNNYALASSIPTWSTLTGKDYNDLANKPIIPVINNSTITSALGYTPYNAASLSSALTPLSNRIDSTNNVASGAIAVMATKASSLFSQVSTATVTGTSETSIKGSLIGTDTIKPSSIYVGKTWQGYQSGSYTTPVVSVGNVTVKVYLGATVVLQTTITNLPLNISSALAYSSNINMTVRTTGGTGSVAASGFIEFNTATSGTSLKFIFTPTITTIDWTTNKIYDARVTYSASGNTLTSVTHILSNLN